MLEKMFTTKMSIDKEKLQNRFSKIRSKNGKTSKFIAIAVFAIIIVSIICVSVLVAVNRQDDKILYKNETMNFQLEIPKSWFGMYTADETAIDDNYIAFKHKRIAEKHDGMGTLFSVVKLPDSEIDEYVNMVGNMTVVWRNQDYGYLIGRPTDVQVPIFAGNDEEDIKLAEEYQKMYRDISFIEYTFSLINDVGTPNIVNAENLSYAQIKDLQRQVDNGHFPWRLDYEQVMQMYLSGMGEPVENGKLTYFAGDGEGCVGTYDIGDKRYTLELFKPAEKNEHGIWIVRSVKEISKDILKEIFFYDCTPYERMIEKLGNWYRVPQMITTSFSWFDVGKEPYPTSVTAYFIPTGTEMDQYKKEIGKIKEPFSYRTMAQVLGMKLQFPDDATTGHLQFVFDYKDGTSEASEYYNILVDKRIEYNGQTGILTNDAALYADASHKEKLTDVKANDLVYVFYESNDSYYVQLPVMDIPPTEGYIKTDYISFDNTLYSNANHGKLAKGSQLYNSASLDDKYYIQESDTVVEIVERKGNFARCNLPGGDDNKWVELKNIRFKLK